VRRRAAARGFRAAKEGAGFTREAP